MTEEKETLDGGFISIETHLVLKESYEALLEENERLSKKVEEHSFNAAVLSAEKFAKASDKTAKIIERQAAVVEAATEVRKLLDRSDTGSGVYLLPAFVVVERSHKALCEALAKLDGEKG